jgi:colanic acid biosynthesis glycosyl transferase WcaI
MHLLYVSQYFPPEMGAPAARVSELARHWTRQGHTVTVLTGFPNHPTGILHEEYRKRIRRLVFHERLEDVDVLRTWLLPLPNRKAWERMLSYSSFCGSACLSGLATKKVDTVIATSPQLLVGLSGLWLSWLKRVPFILEIRDLWPESLVGVGIRSKSSILYRALSVLARFLYRAATHIVVVTPAFRDTLINEWHISSGKITVVENGVETDLFKPHSNAKSCKQTVGLEGKFVVSYIGTLGMAHGLAAVLPALAALQRSIPELVFLLVGEGSQKQDLVDQSQKEGMQNIRFLPQQSRELIPALISASDVCLVLLKKTEIFKTVIPTKMLEFMACARPVVLGVEGQAKELLEKADAGLSIEPEDSAALSRAIQTLHSNETLRNTLGANGRRYIVQHLSRKKTADEYLCLLKKVLEEKELAPIKSLLVNRPNA